MRRNDLLRVAGLAVLLLILILLFLRNPVPQSRQAGFVPGRESSSPVSRTDANGVAWALDQAGGALVSPQPDAPQPGPPIVVRTDVQRAGPREVSIGLILEGQAGEPYRPVIKKNGQATAAPALRIVNETGQVVAQGNFAYG